MAQREALSLTGKIWQEEPSLIASEVADRRAQQFAQNEDLPYPLALMLAKRGIEAEDLGAFLDPRLRDVLPDPSIFLDMDKACALIAEALIAKKPIGIFGDYDVDGACSAAIFSRFFKGYGVESHIHIPDRFKEGYGPNTKALAALKEAGAELIITVDCGITAHEPLAEASAQGMDIIVIDHHKAGTQLPEALAVVNPNRLDDTSGQGDLCAAAVAFMTCVGTNRILRQKGHQSGVDLLSLLDLVAMATICDIVPLSLVNRAFVKQGLKIFKQRQNTGLRLLSDLSGVNRPPTAQTFGFVLGPRINAGGRIGKASLGATLLTTQDEAEAVGIAAHLDELNKERRHIEADIQTLAIDQAEEALKNDPERAVLCVAGIGWHEGVIGIVAGRLKDKYNRPVIVISFNESGQGKGSARGIEGFRLGDNIMAAHQAGLLTGGGGHDMAAGLSIDKAQLEAFSQFMCQKFDEQTGQLPPPSLNYASALMLYNCNKAFVDKCEAIAPFGAGFPQPRFMLKSCHLKNLRWIGDAEQHLSVMITDGTGAQIRAIAFRFRNRLVDIAALQDGKGALFDIVGSCNADDYRGGDAVQFIIDDIRQA